MDGTTKTTAPERLLRCALALLLLCSALVTGTATAQAKTGQVEVTIGGDVPYAGYLTTHMEADGNIAYCADPTSPTPSAGSYPTEGASDDVAAAIWASWGAPGFDATLFPSEWYDGSAMDDDKYLVASHILISYAYQGDKAAATYGTSPDFAEWADDALLEDTWGNVEALKGKVPAAFDAFTVQTGSESQTLVSFSYDAGGLMVAKADSQAGDGPQGDGSLAGAKFEVVNATGAYAYVGGEYHADGDAVMTVESAWDDDAGKYVAKTGKSDLPAGKYLVREAQAPEGYNVSSEAKSVTVGGSQLTDLTGDAFQDDVERGGVLVVKSDKELKSSEAIGGSDHSSAVGPNLSGIEFEVANASAHKVLVDGEWFEPGSVVATITTAWDDDAQAYTARTASDLLPYGTYTVKETKTNGSYLLSDGEAKAFEVRKGGTIVAACKDGGAIEFYDQVVRNDLQLHKKADSTNESLQVPFAITSKTTGESHVIVTDRNGDVSTASAWNKHSNSTNGNDGLLEKESISAEDMDATAGVWFSLGEDGSEAAVDDSLAALPYGEYELKELRCEANEGLQLVTKSFWVERDSGAASAVWMTLDDKEGPKVGTTATAEDGTKSIAKGATATIVDEVAYENLDTSKIYKLVGTLMDKSTGKELLGADGKAITAEAEFAPKTGSGTQDVTFTFDASALECSEVVVFESLRCDGVEVAAHADIADEGQTVKVEEPKTPEEPEAPADEGTPGQPEEAYAKTGAEAPESCIGLILLIAGGIASAGLAFVAIAMCRAGKMQEEGIEDELRNEVQGE